MMEMLRNSLIISEEKNIKNTALYIKNVNINAESYESKILSEENIENIIKFQVVYDGDKRILKYDVSNSISLDEYLKTKKLNKNDLCKIISAVDEILLSVENYLLSENSIALDLKLVRVVKKANNSIGFRFIAIPNYQSDFSYELSRFLIRLLRHVDVDDKDALSLAYALFVRSSKDNYTMNDLMELVDKNYDKNKNVDDGPSIDDLIRYDEEMASEVSEDSIDESKINVYNDDFDQSASMNNIITSDEQNSLVIDAATKEILGENLLDDFDKEDESIKKGNTKMKGLKKKVALKGHISFGIIGYILAPIIIVALPLLYYFVYA